MPKKIKKKRFVKAEKIEDEEEKKRNLMTIGWTTFLVLTMVLSLFAFVLMGSNGQSKTYGKYHFTYSPTSGKYLLNFKSQFYRGQLAFSVFPGDLNQSIPFKPTRVIYISLYNLTQEQKYFVGRSLEDLYQLFSPMNFVNIVPVKNETHFDCKSLTLLFVPGNETLKQQGDCLYLPLNQNLVVYADYITYAYLGILNS